jgi:hypothetical protein
MLLYLFIELNYYNNYLRLTTGTVGAMRFEV